MTARDSRVEKLAPLSDHSRPPGHTHSLCNTPDPWCQDCYDLYTQQAALIYRHKLCDSPGDHRPHHFSIPDTTQPPRSYTQTFYCEGTDA